MDLEQRLEASITIARLYGDLAKLAGLARGERVSVFPLTNARQAIRSFEENLQNVLQQSDGVDGTVPPVLELDDWDDDPHAG